MVTGAINSQERPQKYDVESMKMKLKFTPVTKFALSISVPAILTIALTGCGSSPTETASAQTSSDGKLLAAAAPTATQRPTPKPTPIWQAQTTIPQWSHGKKFSEVPVRATDKVFALTFDDGPWPEYTRQMLAVLAEKDVKATFFMVGQEVSRRPEIAREVRDAGHAIGNHSWDHPSRPRDPKMQVQRTDSAIEKAVGFRPTIFRPPYGIMASMARISEAEGDAVLLWSADSGDWHKPGANTIARRIISQARPGGISLMHDGGGSRAQSVAALPVIIDTLRERGYRFVTVPELLRLRYVAPKATPKPKKAVKIKAAKIEAMQTAMPPSQVSSQ